MSYVKDINPDQVSIHFYSSEPKFVKQTLYVPENIVDTFEELKKATEPSKTYFTTGNANSLNMISNDDSTNIETLLIPYIRNKKRFMSALEFVNIKKNDYLLIGTSQGIVGYNLKDGSTNNFLIADDEIINKNFIKKIAVCGNNVFGHYTKDGEHDSKLYRWNLNKSNKLGEMINDFETHSILAKDDKTLIVASDNLLLEYVINKNKVNELYEIKDDLTRSDSDVDYAISSMKLFDNVIVGGDNMGNVFTLEDNLDFNITLTNSQETPITAIEAFKKSGKLYVAVGNKIGNFYLLNGVDLSKCGFLPVQKLITNPVKKINAIKYFPDNGNDWIYMAINGSILKTDLAKANLGQNHSGDNLDVEFLLSKQAEANHSVKDLLIK